MSKQEKEKMFSILNLQVEDVNFKCNIGEEKWYGDIYRYTKKKLENNNFSNLYDITFEDNN